MGKGTQVNAAALLASMITACTSGSPAGVNGANDKPAATTTRASAIPAATAPSTFQSRQDRHVGGRGGGGSDAIATAVTLPAGFPAALPVPAGRLEGASASGGRWSLLFLTAGSAPNVKSATVDLYTTHGFRTKAPDAIPVTLESREYTIILLVQDQDHSSVETLLSLNITHN